MVKTKDLLGLNARAALYQVRNRRGKIKVAYSKIHTKKLLLENNLPTPRLYVVFAKPERVLNFQFEKLPEDFVIKPEGGNAGKGVMVIKKRGKWAGEWFTAEGQKVNVADLRLHILDILEGRYATYQTKSRAFIEERIPRHPVFRKISYGGTPDIRVIIFNSVPVMAMLRLPTQESGGRANLHQGAVGAGIDLSSGITTHGVYHGKVVRYFPGTKRKLNGIRIPQWQQILEIAVICAQAAGLGYLGVDLVIHPEKGPYILELNANPGLSIQVANMAGLRRRLERVEGLEVRDLGHGIRIAQSLFGERFADKVKSRGLKIVDIFERVQLVDKNKKKIEVPAKIDTSRFRSSIAYGLAKDLGFLEDEGFLWERREEKKKLPVIEVGFYLKERKIKTAMTTSKKLDQQKYPLLIGRRDLEGFLVKTGE